MNKWKCNSLRIELNYKNSNTLLIMKFAKPRLYILRDRKILNYQSPINSKLSASKIDTNQGTKIYR